MQNLIQFDERLWLHMENIFTCSFEIKENPSVSYITLHQPMMKDIPDSEKTYDMRSPMAYILIAKYEDGKYIFAASEFVNWEKLIIEEKFE